MPPNSLVTVARSKSPLKQNPAAHTRSKRKLPDLKIGSSCMSFVWPVMCAQCSSLILLTMQTYGWSFGLASMNQVVNYMDNNGLVELALLVGP